MQLEALLESVFFLRIHSPAVADIHGKFLAPLELPTNHTVAVQPAYYPENYWGFDEKHRLIYKHATGNLYASVNHRVIYNQQILSLEGMDDEHLTKFTTIDTQLFAGGSNEWHACESDNNYVVTVGPNMTDACFPVAVVIVPFIK